MKKCKYCNELYDGTKMSNHVRWKHMPLDTDKGKYLKKCSCIECKIETTVQSIKSHYESKHVVKPMVIHGHCKECDTPIYLENYIFCGSSCSAKHHGKKRPPGHPSRLLGNESRRFLSLERAKKNKFVGPPTPKICVICTSSFVGLTSKTCGKDCSKKLLSMSLKKAIANGHEPNNNRGRGKKSWLESSFEAWLMEQYPTLEFHMVYPFGRKDVVKTYFGDFTSQHYR